MAQAVRQLNLAHCYELKTLEAPGERHAASARWEWSGPSGASIASRPSPTSRSVADGALIERDLRITEVAVVRHSQRSSSHLDASLVHY
jgi:hypothetical protein